MRVYLETGRLVLREFEAADVDDLVELDARRVLAETMVVHTASRRAMEKSGPTQPTSACTHPVISARICTHEQTSCTDRCTGEPICTRRRPACTNRLRCARN